MSRRTRSGARRACRAPSRNPLFPRYRTPQIELLEDRQMMVADALEENNTLATATILGSPPTLTLTNLTIDDSEEEDVDFFKYTAHDTGKLIVRISFEHDGGDIDLRIRDLSGDVIAQSGSVTDMEELTIPVVTQQMYFIEVFGVGDDVDNTYELEIENFPAPVPTGVHLDPADDTGMMNNDNVTSETTPRFFIQTDVLEFVDLGGNGLADEPNIDILTAAGNVPGIAVEVTLVNTTAGTSITGFADPLIPLMPEVYTFTPAAELTSGVYLITARTRIFDLRENPADVPMPATGRSTASPPLWVTIDTGGPLAGMVSADLIASSDTGMLNNDNVTNKMQPAFNGMAPAGSKVRLYVIPNGQTARQLVGQTVAGSDSSDVGIGPIGSIGGAANDGLGLWEITAEPLDSNGYDIRLEVEDGAGNVTEINPAFNPGAAVIPTDIVVDTVEPNTPFLDLITLDDSGRHNTDNITKDNTPQVTMTSSDPNINLAQLLFTDNLKFRIYDRYANLDEFLLYDSALDSALLNEAFEMNNPADVFTAQTLITQLLPAQFAADPAPNTNAAVLPSGVLADGIHNLKLEVEDRAGNISHDFLFNLTIDTTTPLAFFGLPDNVSIGDGLRASSDTGVTTVPATFADRVTSDTTPTFWGRAEANSVVRVFFDEDADGVIDLLTDTFLGQTVAIPLDGNDGYVDGAGNPLGTWEITSVLDMNQIAVLPKDGVRRLLVTAEDVAGNPMQMGNAIADGLDDLQIFIDTQGPQITGVAVNNLTTAQYDLFDPKPSVAGYTPLVTSLNIAVRDLPVRVDQAGAINDFLYEALVQDIAVTPGNFLLVGDHVGTIAIQSIQVTNNPRSNGNPATALVALNFGAPLPDDRYTLTVRDNLVDPANNKLDGESNVVEPQEDPVFPTGDGVPGGSFVARFTIDSRPEIGNFVAQSINIDINGNFIWDPANAQVGNDTTNVDISFTLPVKNADGSIGLGAYNVHDLLFAGRFRQIEDGEEEEGDRYFDQLAAYGFSQELGVFRWIIDTTSDGVVEFGTDILTTQPTLANFTVAGAIPVAGNFDNNAANGDEIGLYNAGKWFLDTNHNFVIGGGDTLLTTNLLGHPIVGDFDGDGQDDLAVFNNNVFSFNLANDGLGDATDATMVWGFPGVLDRPVAADMDQDGIDDIGLWVPRSSATLPQGIAEWYFLLSDEFAAPGVPAAHVAGSISRINHAFTPVPFGKDLYAEFGDQLSLPIVGNFDPPVVAAAPGGGASLAGDYDGNGRVEEADRLVWRATFGSSTNLAADGNGDGRVDSADFVVWRSNLGAVVATGSSVVASSSTLVEPLQVKWMADVSDSAVAYSAPKPAVEANTASRIVDHSLLVSETAVETKDDRSALSASTTSLEATSVDGYFARLNVRSKIQDLPTSASAAEHSSMVDELLLIAFPAGAESAVVSESTPNIPGHQAADDELIDEVLAEFMEFGPSFDLM